MRRRFLAALVLILAAGCGREGRRDPPVRFLEIVQAAIIPAILYSLSILLLVHFTSRRW